MADQNECIDIFSSTEVLDAALDTETGDVMTTDHAPGMDTILDSAELHNDHAPHEEVNISELVIGKTTHEEIENSRDDILMEMADQNEYIDAASAVTDTVERHIRIHTGEKPYVGLNTHRIHKHTKFLGYKDLKQNLNVKYDKNSKLPVFKCQYDLAKKKVDLGAVQVFDETDTLAGVDDLTGVEVDDR